MEQPDQDLNPDISLHEPSCDVFALLGARPGGDGRGPERLGHRGLGVTSGPGLFCGRNRTQLAAPLTFPSQLFSILASLLLRLADGGMDVVMAGLLWSWLA